MEKVIVALIVLGLLVGVYFAVKSREEDSVAPPNNPNGSGEPKNPRGTK